MGENIENLEGQVDRLLELFDSRYSGLSRKRVKTIRRNLHEVSRTRGRVFHVMRVAYDIVESCLESWREDRQVVDCLSEIQRTVRGVIDGKGGVDSVLVDRVRCKIGRFLEGNFLPKGDDRQSVPELEGEEADRAELQAIYVRAGEESHFADLRREAVNLTRRASGRRRPRYRGSRAG